MNIRKIKKTIYEYLEKYNSEYYVTPKINSIELVNIGAWGHFDTKKMFDKQYDLKIDTELFDQNDKFIQQILYHEFTHMYDSTIFIEYDADLFKDIMEIYSEIHASEIQMNTILLTQSRPYDLSKTVIHRGELTLQSFMDQTLKHVITEFTSPSGKITPSNLGFDFKELYYFIGYLLSLKKNGINYIYEYKDIAPEFINIFKKITDYILNNTEYDYNILLKLQNEFSSTIKEHIASHNRKIAENILENVDMDAILQELLNN